MSHPAIDVVPTHIKWFITVVSLVCVLAVPLGVLIHAIRLRLEDRRIMRDIQKRRQYR